MTKEEYIILKSLIESIIKVLDSEDDVLLIGLLEEKLTKSAFTDPYYVSLIDINNIKVGMRSQLRYFSKKMLEDSSEKYNKALRLNYKYSSLDEKDQVCYTCNYSIDNTYHDCDRCNRCLDRMDVICLISNQFIDRANDTVEKVFDNNNEILMIKHLINRINSKIQKLKQNETS